MGTVRNRFALGLFAPIARDYETWSRWLSLGQDPRWRKFLVRQLNLPPGSRVVDVAAGTGEVSRLLAGRGLEVFSLDQSREMVMKAKQRGAVAVISQAERMPFPDNTFDGLTFTYLLRYVDNVTACMEELVRVVRPGGVIGMVEFGRPQGAIGVLWRFYTRRCLPVAGSLISPGWQRVGNFLGASIEEFHDRCPVDQLVGIWERAGAKRVRCAQLSAGGGLIMWGRKQ